MSQLSQREAVFSAVCQVTGQESFDTAVTLSDDQRSSVISILCEGFKDGSVFLADTESNKEKLSNNSEMRKYVSGLVSNWLRKDPNLNGGTKHTIKNPGSRAGQGDEQIKNLKALRTLFVSQGETAKIAVIDAAIEKRNAEIAAERAASKVKEIDYSVLDPKLVAMLNGSEE